MQRGEVSISRAQQICPVRQVAPNQDIVVVEPDLPHAVLRNVPERVGQLAEFGRPHICTHIVPQRRDQPDELRRTAKASNPLLNRQQHQPLPSRTVKVRGRLPRPGVLERLFAV